MQTQISLVILLYQLEEQENTFDRVHRVCEKHEDVMFHRVVRTDDFFNNLRKRRNESEVEDCVTAFRKSKREKNGSFGGQIS